MVNLEALPCRAEDGAVHVLIESPRGAKVKLKYEPELGVLTLSRPLALGLAYPFDWGFVPGTRAEDGDPLDAMVISDVSTYPGVLLRCRPLGVIKLEQRKSKGRGRERNDRVIFVLTEGEREKHLRSPRDLAARTRAEVEKFFLNATFFTAKNAEVVGWGGSREAERLVNAAEKAYPRGG